jgi:glycerol-3-phosphate acyltransferase PlsX
VRIALDAMGGDYAPRTTVEGAVLAARELGLEIVLVGDQEVVAKELKEHDVRGLKLTIEHAPEVVAMDESPMGAVLDKPRSSLHVCYELLKRGTAAAAISAGNSGAMMTIGIALMGNIAGIDRPAIASVLPTLDEISLLIDAGANTEVKPHNLVQFALMGSVYMRHLRGLHNPRIAILSNGEEDSKGDEVTRAAAAILRQMPALNYVGYIEGRDINHGKADVIVTDGFTGNVVLKTMEGFARFLLGNLREIYTGSMRGRLGYLMTRKRLTAMRERFDPSEYGGAPLLGINGAAFIAHGSSNARAIRNALRAAASSALGDAVNREIVVLMAQNAGIVPVQGGKGLRGIFNRMRDRLQRRGYGEGTGGDGGRTGSLKETGSLKTGSLKIEPPPAAETSTALHPPVLNGATPALVRKDQPALPEPAQETAPPAEESGRKPEE